MQGPGCCLTRRVSDRSLPLCGHFLPFPMLVTPTVVKGEAAPRPGSGSGSSLPVSLLSWEHKGSDSSEWAEQAKVAAGLEDFHSAGRLMR